MISADLQIVTRYDSIGMDEKIPSLRQLNKLRPNFEVFCQWKVKATLHPFELVCMATSEDTFNLLLDNKVPHSFDIRECGNLCVGDLLLGWVKSLGLQEKNGTKE